MYKFVLLFVSAILWSSCVATISTSGKPVNDTPPQKISKILVIEESSNSTAEFYNKFRKAITRQMAHKGIKTSFSRLMIPPIEGQEQKVENAIRSFEPDAIMYLSNNDSRKYRWGPLNRSVKTIDVRIKIKQYPSESPIWEGEQSIQQTLGVDVAAESAVEKLLAKMTNDGIFPK